MRGDGRLCLPEPQCFGAFVGDSSGRHAIAGHLPPATAFPGARRTRFRWREFHDVYSNSSNNYASRRMMDFSVFSTLASAAITGTAADQTHTAKSDLDAAGGVDCKRKRSSSIAPGRERPPTRVNSDSMKSPGSAGFLQGFFQCHVHVWIPL